MTDTPPNSWTDPYGTVNPGSPPPGYWIASDGRWYPPESAPQASEPVQPAPIATPAPGPADGPAPQGFAPPMGAPDAGFPGTPPTGGDPGSGSGSSTKLVAMIAAGAAAVLLLGGIGAFFVLGGDGDDDPVLATAETTIAGDDTTETTVAGDDTTETTVAEDDTTETTAGGDTETTVAGDDTTETTAESGSTEPVTGTCDVVDEETVLIDITNTTGKLTNLSLTLAFYDDANNRISDESAYISAIRPGERSIQEAYIFDGGGPTCEIIDVDDFDYGLTNEAIGDATDCEIIEIDQYGFIDATLNVTNSDDRNNDYVVQTAFVDGDGVRRAEGSSYIETVRPGETAPGDIFGSAPESLTGVTCEIVAVSRTASE